MQRLIPPDQTIRLALRELGYIEGQNICHRIPISRGEADRLAELAAELVRLKVDVIVTAGGTPGVRAAMNMTKTIPIVMSGSGSDPVEVGLVESVASPGGNVTGMSTLLSRVWAGKRLELLKETVPKAHRFAVLYQAGEPTMAIREVEEDLPTVAHRLGLTVRSWEIRGADRFDKVFTAMSKQRPDGLYVSPCPLMRDNQNRIVGFALESRLPSLYGSRESVDAGGLMFYGADLSDSYRRVAMLCGQNSQGLQACRSACRATD